MIQTAPPNDSATKVRWHPSPNFGDRRDGAHPELVVLHYTAMESATAAIDRLCAPEHEVSAHYLIGVDGTCWQLVEEAKRAWHAGAGNWRGKRDVNSRSIGIELDNDGATPFSEPQMAALEALLGDILHRCSIPPEAVIGHSDMAPSRKGDPGPRFDWARLALRGLARHSQCAEAESDLEAADSTAFLTLLRSIGYPSDENEKDLLLAFRLRFRPWGRGALTVADLNLAGLVAARFAVDPSAHEA